jgi:hypothetical protein
MSSGRSQQVTRSRCWQIVPLVAAALLLTKGWPGLRWGGSTLFFLMFMVPLPGVLVAGPDHTAEDCRVPRGRGDDVCRLPGGAHGVILYVGPTSCWWPTPVPA